MSIKSFTNLIVWQKSHALIIDLYKKLQGFPKEELYGLTSQMKRCSVSVSSNIAEGFVRKSKKEKINFYCIALGSITELQNQLLLARDLTFISKEVFNKFAGDTIEISKMLNTLIKRVSE